MKIFFWSYRRLIMVGAVLLVLLGVGLATGEKKQSDIEVFSDNTTYQPIYQGTRDKNHLALTFNVDWGEEYLPGILNVLDTFESKATFFLTGRWAKKFPELVSEIAEHGHEIGNHGYSHSHPDQISKEKNKQEIIETEKLIAEICKKKTNLFAPPYGEHSTKVLQAAAELDYKTILWTIDTIDWDQSRSPEVIRARVIDKAENGAIILLHPTDRTLKALPLILENLDKKGFEVKTVTEVLK